jgi:hypothetical protein
MASPATLHDHTERRRSANRVTFRWLPRSECTRQPVDQKGDDHGKQQAKRERPPGRRGRTLPPGRRWGATSRKPDVSHRLASPVEASNTRVVLSAADDAVAHSVFLFLKSTIRACLGSTRGSAGRLCDRNAVFTAGNGHFPCVAFGSFVALSPRLQPPWPHVTSAAAGCKPM